MAGGRASIAPTEITMNAAGQRMTLNIDQLSVSELFKIAGVAGLQHGRGRSHHRSPAMGQRTRLHRRRVHRRLFFSR
jgi:hypothetical protein